MSATSSEKTSSVRPPASKSFSMPSNPDYECGDPIGEEITRQYLNCLCGENVWEDQCGSGQEEGLEAIFMAMCRASENPPSECFSDKNQFEDVHVGSNAGLLREDSTLIPIIVTDEGDVSTLAPRGSDTRGLRKPFREVQHQNGFCRHRTSDRCMQ